MFPRGGDFKATLGLRLATHVGEIRIVDALSSPSHIGDETFGQHRLPGQVRANLEQGIGGEHLHLLARAASRALLAGSTKLRPMLPAARTIASAPRIGRSSPESDSSPANS
jgi:hypothetical protein